MSEKWTPGPWLIDPNNESCIVGSEVDLNAHGDPAYPDVCEISHSYYELGNARLIAAAPDLAEVARMVLAYDIAHHGEDTIENVRAYEAIIAKARATLSRIAPAGKP